jgi:hypothetical protein
LRRRGDRRADIIAALIRYEGAEPNHQGNT